MIKNKKDYKDYYLSDLKSTGIYGMSFINRLFDRRFRFYKSLRKCEYYYNCKNKGLGRVMTKILILRHRYLCDKYSWTVPINVFDKGLAIVHVGTIVVSGDAKIGENCRIHACTNIGNAPARGIDGAPKIGDNVYIGPGAKIFGGITLGNNLVVGANSVVNKSFEDGNCTIAGVPAKKISDKNSENYIIHYEE